MYVSDGTMSTIRREKHRGGGKKKHKYRKSRRHNPPSQVVKLMEEAVPSDNGIYTGQRERILPAGTIDDQSDINEIFSAPSQSETQSLEYLASVAENVAKLQ